MSPGKSTRFSTVRLVKSELLQLWGRWAFRIFERFGLHVTPVHFYEPIPDTRNLDPILWSRKSALVGIDMREDEQLRLLETFSAAYRDEYERFPRESTDNPYEYYTENKSFIPTDGEILYCMIRHFKPRRVYEVGSGNSTCAAALAVRTNIEEGSPCEFTAFEPYPNEIVRKGIPGVSRLIESKIEKVDMSEFEKLQENDILFIDSSHVVRIGNDVQFLYLEVLPRLRKGVIVHIHDIFMPDEYPREWILRDHLFWNEQYLLTAFLTLNRSYEVLWAAMFMHTNHPDSLERCFPAYNRAQKRPCSFWIRRCA